MITQKALYWSKKSEALLEYAVLFAYRIINKLIKPLYKFSKPKVFFLSLLYKPAATVWQYLPTKAKVAIRRSSAIHKLRSTLSGYRSPNRYYLNKGIKVDQFFIELKNRHIRYSILRWWEDLPNIAPGEDIDILIQGDDFLKLSDLVNKISGSTKIDFYSDDGRHGLRYGSTLYFPFSLSRETLKNSYYYKEIYSVPTAKFYTLTMAFHILFHKGANSHVSGFEVHPNHQTSDHDYSSILLDQQPELKDINKQTLLAFLEENDFLPDPDAFSKYVEANPTTYELMPSLVQDVRGGELSLFVVRGAAIENHELYSIKATICYEFYMEILYEKALNSAEKDFLYNHMRGANWGRGPYANSGGVPEYIIIAFDYHPTPIPEKYKDSYPFFTNYRLLKCKSKARDFINGKKLFGQQYNPLHTTDNETEALAYIKKLLTSDDSSVLNALVSEMRDSYKTTLPVLKTISCGRRSKVELVEHNAKKAIKKTFRSSAHEFFENELRVYQQLQPLLPAHIPKLISHGKYYLIIEYMDFLTPSSKSKHREQLRQFEQEIFSIISFFYDQGYAFINFIPENVAVTSEGGIYVFDFEFVQPYDSKPESLLCCYELQGTPKDFHGHLPAGKYTHFNSYEFIWKPVFSKSLSEFYSGNKNDRHTAM